MKKPVIVALVLIACGGPSRVVYSPGNARAECALSEAQATPCSDFTRPDKPLPLGQSLLVHTSWEGSCKRDPQQGMPGSHAGDVEPCEVVEHSISATCNGVACKVALSGKDNFIIEPTAKGTLTVEVQLVPKTGAPQKFSFGPIAVVDAH